MDSAGTLDVLSACFKAVTPNSGAVKDFKAPLNEPTGVLDAATITTSCGDEND